MTPEEAEFYPTPAWCVRRILEAVDIGPTPQQLWLDPCVGGGAIVRAVEATCKQTTRALWMQVDIRDTGLSGLTVADYLRHDLGPMGVFDVCIMNPPFSKALQFAQKALVDAKAVLMLQRLNWLQAPDRADWSREHPPNLYVLPERPSFTGSGTDGGGYAWYVWGCGSRGVHVLASTPDAERKADEAAAQVGRYRGPEQLGLDVAT